MRIKVCLIWAGAIVVTIAAIFLPGYLIDMKISSSYEKAISVNNNEKDSKVSWLPENEEYSITSLMLQGKLDTTKTLIKEETLDNYRRLYKNQIDQLENNKKILQEEKLFPFIHTLKDGEIVDYEEEESSNACLYQYKENIFYNYEVSVWEIHKKMLSGKVIETIQIDEDGRLFGIELTVEDNSDEYVLDQIFYDKEQLEHMLKIVYESTFSIIREESIPDSSITQRFLITIGEDKQQYWLDIESINNTFDIKVIATEE